jgi:hypothetical protein
VVVFAADTALPQSAMYLSTSRLLLLLLLLLLLSPQVAAVKAPSRWSTPPCSPLGVGQHADLHARGHKDKVVHAGHGSKATLGATPQRNSMVAAYLLWGGRERGGQGERAGGGRERCHGSKRMQAN